ncbi:general substrate transporter [Syncephalis fuscata]|nr:general substrate transporter [Syncephalis fuscata]
MSGHLLFSVLATSMGGFLFGFDTAAASNIRIMPAFVQHIVLGNPAMGRLVAFCFTVSGTLTSFLSGTLSDRHGRRISIIAGVSIFIAGSGMETAADNLVIFCIGRSLAGAGIGLIFAIAPIYIAEVSPTRLRGSLMAIIPFAIACGAVMAFTVDYLSRNIEGDVGWRIPFAVQSSMAMIMLTGVMLMPQSPRWLLAHGHDKEASLAFCKLNGLQPEQRRVINEFDGMRVAMLADHMDNRNKGLGGPNRNGTWRVIFAQKTRKRMFLAMFILALQQPSELTANIYYFPGVLRAAGINDDSYVALLGTGGIGAALLVISGIGVLVIDRVGRRPLMIYGSVIMSVSFIILTTLAACRSAMPENKALSIAYATVACIISMAGAISWRVVGWIYPIEILPNRLRSRAMSLACSFYWLFKLFMIQMAPWLLGKMEWGTYATLAITYGIVAFWVYHYLPETKNMSLEKIAAQFNKKKFREPNITRK